MPGDIVRSRPLVIAPRGLVGVPWGALGRALWPAVFMTMTIAASCAPLFTNGGGTAFVVMFALSWVLCAAILGGPAWWAARRTWVAVDEGGVRCRIGPLATYWPFALIGHASIDGGFFSVPSLTLSDVTGRPFLRMPLLRRAVRREASKVADAVNERRRAAPPASEALSTVDRQHRSLDEWRRELDARVRGGDDPSYRGRVVDFEALLDAATDVRQKADLRAGAMYAVLAGAPAPLREAARASLSEASPPIVLRMAQLASPDLDARLEGALPFLDPEDRPALPAHSR